MKYLIVGLLSLFVISQPIKAQQSIRASAPVECLEGQSFKLKTESDGYQLVMEATISNKIVFNMYVNDTIMLIVDNIENGQIFCIHHIIHQKDIIHRKEK